LSRRSAKVQGDRRHGRVVVICENPRHKQRQGKETMARISAVDIRGRAPRDSLTYIFGIGLTMSQEICARTDVDPNTRVRDLTDEEITRPAQRHRRQLRVEGDLRRDISRTSSARWRSTAIRACGHRKGLPSTVSATQHQRPHRKGPKKTVAERRRSASRCQAHRKDHFGARVVGSARTSPTARHIKSSFNKRSSRSPTPRQRPRLGVGGQRGLQGRASPPPSPPSWPRSLCRRAMEHGVPRSTFWCGPGLGRETANPLPRPPPASRSSASRTSHPSPTTAAAPRSGAGLVRKRGPSMARYTGPVCRALPRERTNCS